MLTLAIETSGKTVSVALMQDDRLLAERLLSETGRRHAQSLVAEIDELFSTHHHAIAECDIVAVSIGPGSFTGLRVGVVCAKTLAYATGCQLAAIDTFQAIAENAPQQHREVTVIANAQRNELFVGHYLRDADGWFAAASEIEIVNCDQFSQRCQPEAIVTGPGVKLLESTGWHHANVLPEEQQEPQASRVALLGVHAVQQGQATDYWQLVPRYLRLSAAEEKANRAS